MGCGFYLKADTNHTVRNLHFLSKNSTLMSQEKFELFWVKTRENAADLDFLVVDNFDFPRKNVELFWVKTPENAAVLDF